MSRTPHDGVGLYVEFFAVGTETTGKEVEDFPRRLGPEPAGSPSAHGPSGNELRFEVPNDPLFVNLETFAVTLRMSGTVVDRHFPCSTTLPRVCVLGVCLQEVDGRRSPRVPLGVCSDQS